LDDARADGPCDRAQYTHHLDILGETLQNCESERERRSGIKEQ
jgi:hypothetical protein